MIAKQEMVNTTEARGGTMYEGLKLVHSGVEH